MKDSDDNVDVIGDDIEQVDSPRTGGRRDEIQLTPRCRRWRQSTMTSHEMQRRLVAYVIQITGLGLKRQKSMVDQRGVNGDVPGQADDTRYLLSILHSHYNVLSSPKVRGDNRTPSRKTQSRGRLFFRDLLL